MCKLPTRDIINAPIGKSRARSGELIAKVQAGAHVVLTNHGKPEVIISSSRARGKRWRVAVPDDPALVGDLQSPILGEW